MSANNQSRSLIIASKMQGWDPTKCDGKDIAAFDVPSAVDNAVQAGKAGVGALPGGTPDGWPDGADSEHPSVGDIAAKVTWNTPKPSK